MLLIDFCDLSSNDLQVTAIAAPDSSQTRDHSLNSPTWSESSWYHVRIEVVPITNSTRQLRGRVRFHLHPTFVPNVQDVQSRDNKTILKLRAWGAFTVGIEVFDEPYTQLELDLADSPKVTAPVEFRKL